MEPVQTSCRKEGGTKWGCSVPSCSLGHMVEPIRRSYLALSEVESAFFRDISLVFNTLSNLSLPALVFCSRAARDESLTALFTRLHHLAIIPDGNRTWGRQRGLNPQESHRWVVDSVIPQLLSDLYSKGLHTLTLWLFSTENWSRDKQEVDNLMQMIEQRFADICLPICHEHKVSVHHLGRKDRLPVKAREAIDRVERETANYTDHVFNVAIDYGGQDEILRALSRLNEKKVGVLDAKTLAENLDTAGQPYPYPDFIIRTSGQKRLSGFMPWQSCYSEVYFEKRPFPEMTTEIFHKILGDFGSRERRWGR